MRTSRIVFLKNRDAERGCCGFNSCLKLPETTNLNHRVRDHELALTTPYEMKFTH